MYAKAGAEKNHIVTHSFTFERKNNILKEINSSVSRKTRDANKGILLSKLWLFSAQ